MDSQLLHVFILLTPLHALLARKIIEKENIVRYHLISFIDGSQKIIFYRKLITEIKENYTELELKRNHSAVFVFLKLTRLASLLKSKSRKIVIYSGSIKSLYTRITCILLEPNLKQLNAFDDGFGNISESGYFYDRDKPLKNIFFSLYSKRHTYPCILNEINTHFTIYKTKNIYDKFSLNKKFIDLTDSLESGESDKRNEVIRVLLTGPFAERGALDEETELLIYEAAIERFSIELRLPHPAENPTKTRKFTIQSVETMLIAEEWVPGLLKDYSRVEIYGFGSSALLNLAYVERIECHWVSAEELPFPSLPEAFHGRVKRDFISKLNRNLLQARRENAPSPSYKN